MSQFRPALDAFVDGQSDLPALERELRSDLEHEPAQAQVFSDLIETKYRSGHITGPAYRALVDVVRSTVLPTPPASDTDETRHSAETRLSPSARPPAWSQENSREPQPGDVIKERFVLEDIIGKGGMGVVFRARDIRKEEAQDRNPHVALKVLNENFKRHPESLKALQREARKAQTLAHPNIVTVYDFDREGANVYMVMELMDGEPLDRFIKRLHGTGLPIAKALPIIRALGAALTYAHEHGVVHSDFKPANAFLGRKGVVKVFDFGIARAAKHPDQERDQTSTHTLFDAGTLGALTPAYASCEMLEGLDPDPRDDIYALGCVAYELLTGAHPFNSKPATLAREGKLKPRPIQGLTSRQWRALRRALAFERTARSPSVSKFLEEITPEQRSPARWIAAAVALIVIGIVAAYMVPNYLQSRNSEALAALVRSGKPESIGRALPQIEALSADVRAKLLLDENLRTALIKDFNVRIEAATDSERQRYDYPLAATLIAQLTRLFPDSQAVARIDERVTARRNDQIKQLSDRFDQYLQQGWLVEAQNPENVSSVLAIIARIDPRHPLLADPRLPSAYAEQARAALQKSDAALAQLLVGSGLVVAPSDRTLQDLNDRASREVNAQQRVTRLAELRGKLTAEFLAAATLADFNTLHADLALLRTYAPQDGDLSKAQSRLQQLVAARVQSLAGQSSFDDAQDLVAQYADLESPQFIESQRAGLAEVRGKSTASSDLSRMNAAITGLKAELDALLKSPAAGEEWDARVGAQLAKLSAYLPPADAYLANARHTAATGHIATAVTLRTQGRLSEAQLSLQRARVYAPTLPAIAQEAQQIAQMRAAQDARDLQEKRAAQLAALRQKLLDQAKANEVAEAAASLRELRADLPANDPFLTTAPQAIASAYARLAANAMRDGQPDAAVTLVDRAIELDRKNAQLVTLREKYAQQVPAQSSAASTENIRPATAEPQATVAMATPTPAQSPSAQPTTVKTEPATQIAAVAPQQVPSQVATRPAGSSCTAELAGYGSRSRGVCFDTLPTGRGPDLVVVPAGSGAAKPFAIGRFEISAADYAEYCKQSGKCQGVAAQADMPLTAVPIDVAESYVEWLSATTGFVYRLPTDAEWSYVAGAPGGSAERDYNCVVEINGQQIRGFALGSVRSGKPNGWGVYNLVGNAQEWVKTAGGWSVRGGAFNDPISQCGPALARSSSGAAAANTGFRVLRELR